MNGLDSTTLASPKTIAPVETAKFHLDILRGDLFEGSFAPQRRPTKSTLTSNSGPAVRSPLLTLNGSWVCPRTGAGFSSKSWPTIVRPGAGGPGVPRIPSPVDLAPLGPGAQSVMSSLWADAGLASTHSGYARRLRSKASLSKFKSLQKQPPVKV